MFPCYKNCVYGSLTLRSLVGGGGGGAVDAVDATMSLQLY